MKISASIEVATRKLKGRQMNVTLAGDKEDVPGTVEVRRTSENLLQLVCNSSSKLGSAWVTMTDGEGRQLLEQLAQQLGCNVLPNAAIMAAELKA